MWCGNETKIYEYDRKTGAVTQLISGLIWTNGFCFDPRSKIFYLNNACGDYATNAYQWDKKTGSLSKLTVNNIIRRFISFNDALLYIFSSIYNFPQTNDFLYYTGVQVDRNGFLYVGEHNKGVVYCIDPK